MLPKPQCTFTIPSLHDDLKLEGRLYFPNEISDHNRVCIKGFAIFAHPYAPLGGNWDDPVVQTVGALLIQQGYVLSTFNFRGALGSYGSTSWTGKAELGDYTSFYLLLFLLINAPEVVDYLKSMEHAVMKPLLVLGGYSYGSLISSHLPNLDAVHKIVEGAHEGSSAHEIRLRAAEMSKTLLGYLESQVYRGQGNMHNAEVSDLPPHRRSLALGGYESGSPARRISRESLRNSVDKFRHKLISKNSGQSISKIDSASTSPDITILPMIAYLLVSPLLGPVSGLTTLFTRLKFEHKGRPDLKEGLDSVDYKQSLTTNPSFVIYGNSDGFTSAKKLRRWAVEIESSPQSQLVSKEVEGVGHFWTEDDARRQLCNAIQSWLDTLFAHEVVQDSTLRHENILVAV